MEQDGTWKVIVALGGGLAAAGVAALALNQYYALVLIVGGCAVGLLGLVRHWIDQRAWTAKPRVSRGLRCTHYPAYYQPQLFPDHPHVHQVHISVRRTLYPPDVRVFCNGPISMINGWVAEIVGPETSESEMPPEVRELTRYATAVDAVSLHFSPLQPIRPPAGLHLNVYSNQPIRVRRVKRLKTKY